MSHSLGGGSGQTLMEEESIEEVVTTRKHRGWKLMPYILGNETAEKIATYGLTTNLIVYLVDYYNMGQLKATNLTNIFSGFTNFSPLVGAFVSDAYLGRFRTIACGSFASLLGMVVITLSASIPHLKPPSCSDLDQQAGNCAGPSTLQLGLLYLSLALLVIGSGGVRPCSLPFGVDQFDQATEKGRRGLNSYFNWYYATTCAAIVVALTIIVYIQESISWPIGFGIPAACMVISIIFFYLGTSLYVHVPPNGSGFCGIAQVCVAAILKRKLNLPYPDDVMQQESVLYNPPESQGTFKLRLSLQFKFLNKAAIVSDNELNSDGYAKNPWKLSSVQQVEELKCLIRIIPVWISGIIFFVVVTQLWNFSILQSLKMDRHLGSHFEVPAVSVGAIAYLALTLFVPIYDWILVPMARRITKVESGITTLQRQGVGFLIASIAMVVGALVENKRRESALSHGGMSPISTFLLAPQLILLGIAEAFNAIGQMEFYNLQFPEHMQTVASAVFYCNQGIASYLSNAVVSVVNNITSKDGKTAWLNDDINIGKVDYFYYAVGIMGMVGLLYFLICAHFYEYKSMQSVEEEESSSVSVLPSKNNNKIRVRWVPTTSPQFPTFNYCPFSPIPSVFSLATVFSSVLLLLPNPHFSLCFRLSITQSYCSKQRCYCSLSQFYLFCAPFRRRRRRRPLTKSSNPTASLKACSREASRALASTATANSRRYWSPPARLSSRVRSTTTTPSPASSPTARSPPSPGSRHRSYFSGSPSSASESTSPAPASSTSTSASSTNDSLSPSSRTLPSATPMPPPPSPPPRAEMVFNEPFCELVDSRLIVVSDVCVCSRSEAVLA